MTSFLRLSWQALSDRKLRSILTITMVLIGSALIIAVNGMSEGTVVYIEDQFDILSPNILIASPRSTDLQLTDQDIEKIRRIDGISEVVPYIQNGIIVSTINGERTSIVVGMEQAQLPIIFASFELKEGEIVSETDSFGVIMGIDLIEPESKTPLAGIGDVVKLQYQKSDGRRVIIEKKSFFLRGIINEIGASAIGMPVDEMCFISLREANYFFDRKGIYDGFYVVSEDKTLNDQIRDKIQEEYDVSIFNPSTIVRSINNISGAVANFVNNIAIVSLGVAAVGIITTLYTSMMERIKEIGTLKALGYKKRQILALFLNEALIIGIIGGTIGLGLGIVLGYIMNELVTRGGEGWNLKPIFEPHIFVFTWVLAVALSMASGFYPAWRAAELDPVVALRKE
ncbi:ABC transporter permease [Candidatus Hodarchaeum mangrovi]